MTGLPLHLIQRGNNRSACFRSDSDYLVYLNHLQELAGKFNCAVHAYVLMTNHVHLLVTPACADGPSLMMKHLGQRYVQYFNRKYERSGTLWEGRFRSSIVQEQNYLLRCYRYIEMNPVRAGIVCHPAGYPWSSYRVNAEGASSCLLRPHDEYVALAQEQTERLAAYRSMFNSELATEELDEIRAAANSGYVLGSDRFKAEVTLKLGRRVGPGASGRPRRTDTPAPRQDVSLF